MYNIYEVIFEPIIYSLKKKQSNRFYLRKIYRIFDCVK